jgi:hypothetical protein
MINPLAGMGGCLVSEAPLIAAHESERPVAPGVYVALEDAGSDSGQRFTVAHAGPDTIAGESGADEPFMLRFRDAGDGLHALQAQIDDVCLYGAIRVTDGRVDIWLAGGDALTAADRAQLGLYAGGGDCEIPHWDALAAAVRMVAARKPPSGAFVPAS